MNTIAIYANTNKEQAVHWSSRALLFLQKQDVRCIISNTLAEYLPDEVTAAVEKVSVDEFEKFADVVVCFGGDGTMLSAAQKIIRGDIPLMGINVGKLGFLAEFSVTELEESLLVPMVPSTADVRPASCIACATHCPKLSISSTDRISSATFRPSAALVSVTPTSSVPPSVFAN